MIQELATNIATSVVTSKINELTSKLGVSTSTVQSILNGNLNSITSSALGIVQSKLGIDINTLKTLPIAKLDSLVTSASDKIGELTSGSQIMDKLKDGLNISMENIVGSDVFKNALTQAGISSSILNGIDMSKITTIDELKTKIGEAVNGSMNMETILKEANLPTSIMNQLGDVSSITSLDELKTKMKTISGITDSNIDKLLTNVKIPDSIGNINIDNVFKGVLDSPENLIKNFGVDRIKETALAEIQNAGLSSDVLKRFME